jgi:hypothetical protein
MTKSKTNKAATAMGYTNKYEPPRVNSVGNSILIKHKELIREVQAQIPFNAANARINPGD